jgi:mannose/cellobiose epimerase-like protein (N-acyl-D-glucosamine 2-epimerase family)
MKTKLIPILFVGLLAAQSANAEKMPSMPSMMDDAMDAIERKMEEYRMPQIGTTFNLSSQLLLA